MIHPDEMEWPDDVYEVTQGNNPSVQLDGHYSLRDLLLCASNLALIQRQGIMPDRPFTPIETHKEPIVPAEWQYHEMLRHGAMPHLDPDCPGNRPAAAAVDNAVAAWNRRRVAEPGAEMPRFEAAMPRFQELNMLGLARPYVAPYCNKCRDRARDLGTSWIWCGHVPSPYVDAGMT